MPREHESDGWERAVGAIAGAIVGAVLGVAVEAVRVTIVSGASLSGGVLAVFVVGGVLVGLVAGAAMSNAIAAVVSFVLGAFSFLAPDYWLNHHDSRGWDRWMRWFFWTGLAVVILWVLLCERPGT